MASELQLHSKQPSAQLDPLWSGLRVRAALPVAWTQAMWYSTSRGVLLLLLLPYVMMMLT
jgi:hypothetical protein